MVKPLMDMPTFERKAGTVAALLRAIANPRRLMILCTLVEKGEMPAGMLTQSVGLSQSAVSQHLSRMREEGLLDFRRDGQTLWYRIADPRAETLLNTLYELYCKE